MEWGLRQLAIREYSIYNTSITLLQAKALYLDRGGSKVNVSTYMAHIFVCASAQHGSQISDPDIRVPVRDRKANGTFGAETKGHPENSVLDSVQVFAS